MTFWSQRLLQCWHIVRTEYDIKCKRSLFFERIVNRLRGRGMDLKNVAHHEGFADQQKWTAPFETLSLKGTLKSSSLLGSPSHSPCVDISLIWDRLDSISRACWKGRLMHLALSAELFYSLYWYTIWHWEKQGRRDVQSWRRFWDVPFDCTRNLGMVEISWLPGLSMVMMTKSSDIASGCT